MAGFDDLIEYNNDDSEGGGAIVGYRYRLVVGTTWQITWTVVDDNDANVNMTTGYTAIATFSDGATTIATFTETASNGRQIDISTSGAVVFRCSPTGTAPFAAYVGRALEFNLIVTRTSDGKAVAIVRNSFLEPKPKLNP